MIKSTDFEVEKYLLFIFQSLYQVCIDLKMPVEVSFGTISMSYEDLAHQESQSDSSLNDWLVLSPSDLVSHSKRFQIIANIEHFRPLRVRCYLKTFGQDRQTAQLNLELKSLYWATLSWVGFTKFLTKFYSNLSKLY